MVGFEQRSCSMIYFFKGSFWLLVEDKAWGRGKDGSSPKADQFVMVYLELSWF